MAKQHLIANKGRYAHAGCDRRVKGPLVETVGEVTCSRCKALLQRMYGGHRASAGDDGCGLTKRQQATTLRAFRKARQSGAPFTNAESPHHAAMLELERQGRMVGQRVGTSVFWSEAEAKSGGAGR